MGRLASGTRWACQPLTVQPAIRVRLSVFQTGSHCALYEHLEASERTQSPSGSLPRGADGRAPLTKAMVIKEWEVVALSWFVLSLRIDNEPKLLRAHPSGAHSPDVDDHSSSHCHHGLFLEHFVGAAKAVAPMQDGAVVGLKTDQPPNQLNTFGSQPSRANLRDRAQALSPSSGIFLRNKTEKTGHLASIAKAAPIADFPVHLHHGLSTKTFGQRLVIALD